MKSDDDIIRELGGYLAEGEPTADQLMAAKARLEAHISQATALESARGTDRVVGRGWTRVGRVASMTLGAFKSGVRLAAPLIAGLVVFVVLAPAGGVDPHPQQCWSVFDYSVPCGAALSSAAGAVTAGIVGLALWLNGRRKRHEK